MARVNLIRSLSTIHIRDSFVHVNGTRSIIIIVNADVYNTIEDRVLGNPRDYLGVPIRDPRYIDNDYGITPIAGSVVSDDKEES